MSVVVRISLCVFVICIACFLPQANMADDTNNQALNLQQLLKEVKDARYADQKINRQREARFLKQKNQQKAALVEVGEQLNKLNLLAQSLEDRFNINEQTIQDKRGKLQQRLGNLKELFGHLTAASGDFRSNLDVSIISAQYPGRGQQLDALISKMNNATLLPEVAEIESLWLEMLREMTESSRVVRFNSDVVSPGGETLRQDILRIGAFNLVSADKYLAYSPDGNTISELSRQPASNYLSALPELFSASEDFTQMGIDPTGPTGGSYLAALVDSPDLIERWHQGGLVGYIISGIGLIAALIVIWRLLVMWRMESGVIKLLKQKDPASQKNTGNALGRILAIHRDYPDLDADTMEAKFSEAIIKERPSMERFLPLLKIIAMVAPLLGLLGTVAGMIITFQAITIFGAGDPKAMAGGISSALVTTVLGLLVAIPTVFAHSLLNGKAQNILNILEHQSMGLIALHTQSRNQDSASSVIAAS